MRGSEEALINKAGRRPGVAVQGVARGCAGGFARVTSREISCVSGPRGERPMPTNRQLDDHAELVPHFATRAEIAELREKVMSLHTIVRAIAERNGAMAEPLQDWALCMGQFNSEPGRALATAQRVA